MQATLLVLALTRLWLQICHEFIWRVNALSANLGFCNISTKRQLFMSYCTSFYDSGVCLWNLQKNVLKSFILCGAKVSENWSIYQFALTVTRCHFKQIVYQFKL